MIIDVSYHYPIYFSSDGNCAYHNTELKKHTPGNAA
jgi:hypothetical protein